MTNDSFDTVTDAIVDEIAELVPNDPWWLSNKAALRRIVYNTLVRMESELNAKGMECPQDASES